MADFFSIANAYRDSLQGGGMPRTGSDELEQTRGIAKAAAKGRAEDVFKNVMGTALNVANSMRGYGIGGASTPGVSTPSYTGSTGGSRAPIGDVRSLVQSLAAKRGWSGNQWDALADLIQRESGWNPTAANPTSSAYGLFQFLDSTRKNYGITRQSPLEAQINAGLQYIADRYQDPQRALQHWLARKPINGRDVGHWY